MTGQLTAGSYAVPANAQFAVVAARWNDFIVDSLLEGTVDTLRRHGVSGDRIEVVRVPGAFELTVVCKKLAESGEFAAVIALGCVIRGATAHFEYVSGSATYGLTQVAASTGVPIVFGVLTTETTAQALERAGNDDGNKGREAALTALEMASLMATLSGGAARARDKSAKPAKPAKKKPTRRKAR
ncbi:MAG TPA: 6,7-dimethyl-8-ribityllumazine synthase [Polyangiales bacterium]|jgi:6,7-dimethyl-8-ribityllumazine synthase|nr:6,7-dimethyl-8-ribityllumazine synthase [Polyangiales bacterium]